MKETLDRQAKIIERGRQVGYPLEKIVHPLGIPVIFSAEPHSLTFHELDLGVNDLWNLAQGVTVSDAYEYLHALVVKRDGEPMIAFCTGVDITTIDHLPIAAIFNLTEPMKVWVMGKRIRTLENCHVPAGGLGLSGLLRGDPKGELVQIVSSKLSFLIDARR